MICLHFGIRRQLIRYVDGALPAHTVKAVEEHLLDCGHCRATTVRLRSGRRFINELEGARSVPDVWPAIERAIAIAGRSAGRAKPAAARPKPAIGRLALSGWAIALILLGINGWSFAHEYYERSVQPVGTAEVGPVDLAEFHPVTVRDIESNTRPHIAAEGRVAEVRYDVEDGDLMFKLVDDLNGTDGFIVCEVIDPIRIAPPAVGSRVRVYGVSRYDGQADHKWFEIHPVLNIEPLPH